MTTYFTTRSLNDVDASKIRPDDRIICLIEADDFPGSGPSDRRVFDVAVEGWTGESVDRETRHSASDLPSFTSEDGATVVVISDQIGLTWPGSGLHDQEVGHLGPQWSAGRSGPGCSWRRRGLRLTILPFKARSSRLLVARA